MRRVILVSALILAGCATRPEQQPEAQAPVPLPQSSRPGAKPLLGSTASEVVGYFGNPALQVREGNSLKLQFRGRTCVLDLYLYPSSGGQMRVTYLDARSPAGADMDRAACVSALENAG